MKHIILNRNTKLAHKYLSLKIELPTFLPFVNTNTSQQYFLKSDFLQYLFINFCVALLSMPQGILRSVRGTEMGLEIFRPKERSYLLFRQLNFSDLKSPSALKMKAIIRSQGYDIINTSLVLSDAGHCQHLSLGDYSFTIYHRDGFQTSLLQSCLLIASHKNKFTFRYHLPFFSCLQSSHLTNIFNIY